MEAKVRSDELIEKCQRIEKWVRPRTTQIRYARDILREAVSDWEGITSSGILVKGLHGIHSPHSQGVPIRLSRLRKIFPELEVISKLD